MSYLFLLGAIASEVVGTSLMKASQGFTRLWPTVSLGVAYIASFVLLSQAVKTIPVGVAYALWSALGTAAIVLIGAVFLHEPLTTIKIAGVSLIIGGVVILNLGGAQ